MLKRKKTQNNDESSNVVDSISKARKLYKHLAVLSHPDRNPNNRDLATEISALVNKNKYNYKELKQLEVRIQKELLDTKHF